MCFLLLPTVLLSLQAFCAWKAAQDGQLVRYRVITEAEHQLLRNRRDRTDAYLLDDHDSNSTTNHTVITSSSNSGSGSEVQAVVSGAAVAVVGSKGEQAAAQGKGISVSISVSSGGAAAVNSASRAANVDMVMVVSGADAAKVRECSVAFGEGGGRDGTGDACRRLLAAAACEHVLCIACFS